ncbi:MAG: hypothetical protein JEZ09_04660 [Salinivirgaceae bacterium]|nr:hypothetical protein [Salinivirgaceae bacterium]
MIKIKNLIFFALKTKTCNMTILTHLKSFFLIGILLTLSFGEAHTKEKLKTENKDTLVNSSLVSGLKFRSIGPAFTSGRIADFAVNPTNYSEYYVAVASGNIWKTTNNGITFEPVFDNYGSYSIGCLAIDPKNTNVVWAGTGENNHQRALGYGDGIYLTVDGGKSWKNMGLKESRHIGMILIDGRNSNIVYAACEGSTWGPGGDRGLFKTTDKGKTWNKVLTISENTGINNIICDPRNPDILYATSEQRRRHVHTKIGGGPESAIHKSEDAGKTWKKLKDGLPEEDMGGIGIAISPQNPDVIYAIIEAANNAGGFFRSTDRGESWEKMSDHSSSGQYYNEIYCDPVDFDKVYSVETFSQLTKDGGKTWTALSTKDRHVDDHALWINPTNNKHLIIGGDGGAYITYDGGENWRQVSNLSVTQFYRVAVDNEKPFYNVYGGTQDNATLGGPSRNLSSFGVTSGEWIVTVFGDGFWSQVDPTNPNIVYSEWQYGNVVRYDKKSGEKVFIKPRERKDELSYKWNWNSPIIISHHSPTRLYMAANKVFRSDDRGDNWKVISDDLTTKIDRNTWPVMGKYWSVDAVVKDVSTSQFGTIVSMDESPKQEDLLYVGTDDGLIQITENAGQNWTKINKFPGVPEYTYVSDIYASQFDANTVYASFDNMKRDDFKPYILKSSDKGKSWVSIAANLPENGTVHTIQQDHINPKLLFVGTEFGIFFTINEGKDWVQMKSGIPTIAVRDIAIQKDESDLVLATFGRGFYILDDYSSLRDLTEELANKPSYLFPIKDALIYMETSKIYGQGATYFGAKNPEYGANFSFFLKEVPKTKKEIRHEKEKELFKASKPIPQPSVEELQAEENEIDPYLIVTIKDSENSIIRTLINKPAEGIQRINWDLKYNNPKVINDVKEFNPFMKKEGGVYVLPGSYSVEIAMVHNGISTPLAGTKKFEVKPLNNTTIPANNRAEMVAFQKQVSEYAKSMNGAVSLLENLQEEALAIKQTALTLTGGSADLMQKITQLEKQLSDIEFKFYGTEPKASTEEVPPAKYPLYNRLDDLIYSQMTSTTNITGTAKMSFEILKEKFPPVLSELKEITEKTLPEIRKILDDLKAPYTPYRVPKLD